VREPPADIEPDRGEPIGLGREQLAGAEIVRAPRGLPVLAWVPYTGGAHVRIRAYAGEWTRGDHPAVYLRWRDHAGAWDVWVWAAAVSRLPTRGALDGLPAMMRPETVWGGRRRSHGSRE
jgi:hypothetical protein